VTSLGPVLAALQAAGGEVIEGPAPAPNGARLIARHPGRRGLRVHRNRRARV